MSEQHQEAAEESEATPAVSDRSGVGLHACVRCGVELDGDDPRDLCGLCAREPEPGPYAAAVAAYLSSADWLDSLLDAPLVVHARSIAQSLDKQLAAKGEVQSALAGSFDKCLFRLDSRRPRPAGAGEPGDPDQTTIFSFLDG